MFKETLKKASFKKILKPLAFSGAGLLGLTLLLWVGGNAIAAKQASEMDAAAAEYLQQYPATEWNESAHELKRLMVELGFSSITGQSYEEPGMPDPAKSEALQLIRAELTDYLRAQIQKVEGPLDPIPEKVQTYLDDNQADLANLQNYLLTSEVPIFDLAVEEMGSFEYASHSFLNFSNLQGLLLLKAVSDSQRGQSAQMSAALEASLAFNKMLDQRPELISYLVSLIMMDQAMGIMRHLDGVSPAVASQLLANDQQTLGVERLQFDNWIIYKSFQNLVETSPNLAKEFESIVFAEDLEPNAALAVISSSPFKDSYATLANVNMVGAADNASRQLPNLTICTASLEELSSQLKLTAPWWNVYGQIAAIGYAQIAPTGGWLKPWQIGGKKMLAAELTTKVVQAKALAAEQGQWPETLPNLESQACPGEQWVYDVSPEGQMTLSFSHDLPWLAIESPFPLSYQSTLPKGD